MLPLLHSEQDLGQLIEPIYIQLIELTCTILIATTKVKASPKLHQSLIGPSHNRAQKWLKANFPKFRAKLQVLCCDILDGMGVVLAVPLTPECDTCLKMEGCQQIFILIRLLNMTPI